GQYAGARGIGVSFFAGFTMPRSIPSPREGARIRRSEPLERKVERARQKLHQRRLTPIEIGDEAGEARRARLALGRRRAHREARALEVFDQRVIGGEAAGRPPERALVMPEAGARRALPAARVRDDRLADRAQPLGAWTPEAGGHEDVPGLQVQIVPGRIDV